jgi:uncharacterized membrane protein YjgN (DUF898 family)
MSLDTSVPSVDRKAMGRFHGTGGELFVIWLVNGILSSLTLGIYFAWGRAKLYHYFYSNTEFAGHRFRFTGNGKEIFFGVLRVAAVIIGIGLVSSLVAPLAALSGVKWLVVPLFIALYLGIALLAHYALYGAMRYRLSRARYREIPFRLEGSAWAFAREGLGRALLGAITFGICMPLYRHFVISRLYNNARFGNIRFAWDAKAGEYWWLCIKGGLLSLVTLGVYYFFWYPRYFAYVRGHMSLGGNRFQGEIKPGEFAGLFFTNLLLAAVTFGIGMPWIVVRTLNFFLGKLELENAALLDTAISAGLQKTAAGAEAMADALDLGVGLGF